MVVLTGVITVFTYLVWRVYARIEWLTGAMETHSNLILRLEAKRGIDGTPIKVLWWDPTIEEPPVKRVHGEEVDLSTIYLYVPLRERRHRRRWLTRLRPPHLS